MDDNTEFLLAKGAELKAALAEGYTLNAFGIARDMYSKRPAIVSAKEMHLGMHDNEWHSITEQDKQLREAYALCLITRAEYMMRTAPQGEFSIEDLAFCDAQGRVAHPKEFLGKFYENLRQLRSIGFSSAVAWCLGYADEAIEFARTNDAVNAFWRAAYFRGVPQLEGDDCGLKFRLDLLANACFVNGRYDIAELALQRALFAEPYVEEDLGRLVRAGRLLAHRGVLKEQDFGALEVIDFILEKNDGGDIVPAMTWKPDDKSEDGVKAVPMKYLKTDGWNNLPELTPEGIACIEGTLRDIVNKDNTEAVAFARLGLNVIGEYRAYRKKQPKGQVVQTLSFA